MDADTQGTVQSTFWSAKLGPRLSTQFENLTKCPARSRCWHSASSTCNSVLTSITSKPHAYFSLYYARSSTHLSHLRGADRNKMAATTRRLRQGFKTLHSTGARVCVWERECVCVWETVCVCECFERVTALVCLMIRRLIQLFDYLVLLLL